MALMENRRHDELMRRIADLLIRIAQLPHLVQAKWSNQILDEMINALSDVLDELVRDSLVGSVPLLRG